MSNEQKLLGNLPQGLFFVISAPAGTGKTTLVNRLKEEFSVISESISHTTRRPRLGEKEGIDYFFINEKEFLEKIQRGEFLEYAKVFDDYYGTSKAFVEAEQKKGKHLILVIDTQGAMQIKQKLPATFIFLLPPSKEILKERLLNRKTESKEVIEKRLSWAKKEMAMAKEYDFQIINENLSIAYEVLRAIFIAEEHRVR